MQKNFDPKQQRITTPQSNSSVGSTATRAATISLAALLTAGAVAPPVRASNEPVKRPQDTAASAFEGALLKTEGPFLDSIPNTKPSASDGQILKTEGRILPFGAKEVTIEPPYMSVTSDNNTGRTEGRNEPVFVKYGIPVYGSDSSVNLDMFLHFAKGLHESTGPLRKTPYVDSNHRDKTPIRGVYVDTTMPNRGVRVENYEIFVGRDLIGPADSIFTVGSVTMIADRSSYSIGDSNNISVLDFAYYVGSYTGAGILFAALSPKDKSKVEALVMGLAQRPEVLKVFDLSSYVNAKECADFNTREPFSSAYAVMKHHERIFLDRLEAQRDKDPEGYRLALDFANFVRLTYESRGPSPFSQTLRDGLSRLSST